MGLQKAKLKIIMLIKARTNPNIFNFPRAKIAASLHAPTEILSGSVLLQKEPWLYPWQLSSCSISQDFSPSLQVSFSTSKFPDRDSAGN